MLKKSRVSTMPISSACARSCWQINRLRLNLIGASLLTPAVALQAISNLITNAPDSDAKHVLKDQILGEIPPVPQLTSQGAAISRSYSQAELAELPFEERFDR